MQKKIKFGLEKKVNCGGFEYAVFGKNAMALPANSTWTQKNLYTQFERKIFRHDLKNAIPYPED